MGGWKAILAAALQALTTFLRYVRARREAAFRERAAADGAGVLLDQLNPNHADASGSVIDAASDARRDAGRVDGQPGRGSSGPVDTRRDGRG